MQYSSLCKRCDVNRVKAARAKRQAKKELSAKNPPNLKEFI